MTDTATKGGRMALEREQATYERELSKLLSQEGQYVVIHGEDVIGVWTAYEDALRAGYEAVGPDTSFLVKKIESSEQIHFCTRDLAF